MAMVRATSTSLLNRLERQRSCKICFNTVQVSKRERRPFRRRLPFTKLRKLQQFDVARYLARHRITGGPQVILHRQGSGAAQLIKLAQEEGADLLVAGAYGHSRLGEWIFGGVTRDLLAQTPICCLMSH